MRKKTKYRLAITTFILLYVTPFVLLFSGIGFYFFMSMWLGVMASNGVTIDYLESFETKKRKKKKTKEEENLVGM